MMITARRRTMFCETLPSRGLQVAMTARCSSTLTCATSRLRVFLGNRCKSVTALCQFAIDCSTFALPSTFGSSTLASRDAGQHPFCQGAFWPK